MALLDILSKLLGRENSKKIARERLRLVLVHDRADTAPSDFLTALKEDLIRVISEYMEIDENALEVSFSNSDNSVALVANIPVIKVRRAVGH